MPDEKLPLGAGEDGAAQVVVLGQLLPRVGHLGEHRERHRVLALRAVHRDDHHRAARSTSIWATGSSSCRGRRDTGRRDTVRRDTGSTRYGVDGQAWSLPGSGLRHKQPATSRGDHEILGFHVVLATRALRAARPKAADDAGIDGLLMSDHIFYPKDLSTPYPYSKDGSPIWPPDTPWPDNWVMIGAMAAVTTRIQFGTAVYIAPVRRPVHGGQAGGNSRSRVGEPGQPRSRCGLDARRVRGRPARSTPTAGSASTR